MLVAVGVGVGVSVDVLVGPGVGVGVLVEVAVGLGVGTLGGVGVKVGAPGAGAISIVPALPPYTNFVPSGLKANAYTFSPVFIDCNNCPLLLFQIRTALSPLTAAILLLSGVQAMSSTKLCGTPTIADTIVLVDGFQIEMLPSIYPIAT